MAGQSVPNLANMSEQQARIEVQKYLEGVESRLRAGGL